MKRITVNSNGYVQENFICKQDITFMCLNNCECHHGVDFDQCECICPAWCYNSDFNYTKQCNEPSLIVGSKCKHTSVSEFNGVSYRPHCLFHDELLVFKNGRFVCPTVNQKCDVN